MAGYLIYDVDIHDPERYLEFMSQIKPIVESFGGEYLVRGGEHEILEGEWSPTRLILIRFPDVGSARRVFSSPEYEEVWELGRSCSNGDVVLVEGA